MSATLYFTTRSPDHELDVVICIDRNEPDIGMSVMPDAEDFVAKRLTHGCDIFKIEFDLSEMFQIQNDPLGFGAR